jgi:hypothetical protein
MARMLFRAREKSLILLVLATFAFVCFGAFFFLPSTNDLGLAPGHRNRVYKVYKEMADRGQEFIIPPPPVLDNPNIRKEKTAKSELERERETHE